MDTHTTSTLRGRFTVEGENGRRESWDIVVKLKVADDQNHNRGFAIALGATALRESECQVQIPRAATSLKPSGLLSENGEGRGSSTKCAVLPAALLGAEIARSSMSTTVVASQQHPPWINECDLALRRDRLPFHCPMPLTP